MRRKDHTESTHQLGNLLERYKRILKPPQASVEQEAIKVIKEVTGISVLPHQVVYTVGSRTLAIKAPSVLRSELKRFDGAILSELKNRLGAEHAPKAII